MKTKSIGIIDSGLGGYTIYQALTDAFEDVSFTFIADQKNVPIGSKPHEELLRIASNLVDKLISMEISEIIVACNTLSSTVLDKIQELYPTVNFYGVIDMTVQSLKPKHKKIIVLGTDNTIKSHAYQDAITKVNNQAWVDEVPASELVSLIEGLADDVDIDAYLKELLKGRNKVDAIVTGCTHFPIVKENIKKFSNAEIVTSIDPMIELVKSMEDKPLGSSHVYTTYDPVRMQNQISSLFDRRVFVDFIKLEN